MDWKMYKNRKTLHGIRDDNKMHKNAINLKLKSKHSQNHNWENI